MLPENDNKLKGAKGKDNDNKDTGSNLTPPEGKDERVFAAHEQAEQDIEKDPELSIHSPNDDLDEGETARLGDDKNDLV